MMIISKNDCFIHDKAPYTFRYLGRTIRLLGRSNIFQSALWSAVGFFCWIGFQFNSMTIIFRLIWILNFYYIWIISYNHFFFKFYVLILFFNYFFLSSFSIFVYFILYLYISIYPLTYYYILWFSYLVKRCRNIINTILTFIWILNYIFWKK